MGSKVNIEDNNLTIEAYDLNLQYKGTKNSNDNLYKRYCTCRDQELDRFWKNSVFVWCFLLLCFSAFGLIITEYVSTIPKGNTKIYIEKEKCKTLLAIIAYFGLLISNIWVWMARGLKAWYEVYESAIWDMESKSNVFGFARNYTIDNYWNIKEKKIPFFCSDSISPSKIVILIGHLLRAFWFIAYCSCLFKSFNCILPIQTQYNIFWTYLICWVFVFGMLSVFLERYKIKHYIIIVGNLIGLLIVITLLYWKFDCIIKDNIEIKLDFLFVLLISTLFVYVCGTLIKSSSLRTQQENMIFQQTRRALSSLIDKSLTGKDKQIITNLYFEVKDNYVKVFFSNKEEKEKYQSYINALFEKNNNNTNWIRKIWEKIIDWLKSKNDESENDLIVLIDLQDNNLKKDIDDSKN